MQLNFNVPETPIVTVHTTDNRGFTPEEIAERCADKLISISDTADPVLQQQARAFRTAMVKVIAFYMQEAIQSDRTTIYNTLIDAGQPQLANAIRSL
jgi:hypothetical protein